MHARSVFSIMAGYTILALVGGCGAARYKSMSVAAQAPAAPLQESLFSKDPKGYLNENSIQEILDRPLEVELPARVGVLPIVAAHDWRGPGPSYDRAPPAVAEFTEELRGGEPFTLVTEMITIPSGALGMEALRELAARYKLRYVLLYHENISRDRRTNGWALGYATVLGSLFLPGDTLHVSGYVEASLFDVKTGLLLFTVRRRVSASRNSNVWHTDDKLARLQQRLATRVAGELAGDVRGAVHRYSAAVSVENRRAVLPVPVADPSVSAALTGGSLLP